MSRRQIHPKDISDFIFNVVHAGIPLHPGGEEILFGDRRVLRALEGRKITQTVTDEKSMPRKTKAMEHKLNSPIFSVLDTFFVSTMASRFVE